MRVVLGGVDDRSDNAPGDRILWPSGKARYNGTAYARAVDDCTRELAEAGVDARDPRSAFGRRLLNRSACGRKAHALRFSRSNYF